MDGSQLFSPCACCNAAISKPRVSLSIAVLQHSGFAGHGCLSSGNRLQPQYGGLRSKSSRIGFSVHPFGPAPWRNPSVSRRCLGCVMSEWFAPVISIAITALLAWSSLRAWRTESPVLRWGGAGLAPVASVAVAGVSVLPIIGLWRLHARSALPVILNVVGATAQVQRGREISDGRVGITARVVRWSSRTPRRSSICWITWVARPPNIQVMRHLRKAAPVDHSREQPHRLSFFHQLDTGL
jgi:hypothetical protein